MEYINQNQTRNMMNNSEQPISKVRAFAELAETRGCYSKSQRGNLETAWTIFLKSASDLIATPESVPVGNILDEVEPVFRKYGSENNVSIDTVRAYQGRVKRLLDDFLAHNGGDFMAWKESLSRTANSSATRLRKRKRSQPAIEEPPPTPFPSQTLNVSHRIVLSEGREGALLLPPKFTDEDIDPVWEQLDALKILIKAQIGALNRKPHEG
jgi:hypothetical protein